MSDPYVTSATITNDGKIQLSVQVINAQDSNFTPGEYVEISGQATQTNGAFANFYDIQKIPAGPNGDENDPNDRDNYYIYVTGSPSPHKFRNDRDVSVIARVARLWLSVLKGQTQPQTPTRTSGLDPTARAGAVWKVKTYSQINDSSYPN